MATLSFSCPKCGKLHERVNSGMVGFKVQCKCGFVFRLGSKADKNEDFGEVIRKKKELKRKTAEAATSGRRKIENPTFDLLPKFDPLDPNREDVASPSNEIQSPISAVSEMGDSGSMELEDFPLPPPLPDEMNHLVEPAVSSTAIEPAGSADSFTEPEALQNGSVDRSQRRVVSVSGSDASVGAIPDDLLADLEADQREVKPVLPSSNGVIREPSKVVKGRHKPLRHKPLRHKSNAADNGSGSVLFSSIGLGLSVILTPIYFVKFVLSVMTIVGGSLLGNQVSGEPGAESLDATLGALVGFTIFDLTISAALGMSILVTGVVAGFELAKSKLYQWPWIIQGGIAGIGLVWGCICCGVNWQSGGAFLGLALTFFLVGLAPLLLMLNSLFRLILR
ncbi:hypothetical protein OAU26_00645 [Mariniblastus sp.]|nr:hypothetical protein [Mariniblastus sp.]